MHSLDGLADPPAKMKLTFRIQKNRQNGQSISFVADNKHSDICPVCTAYQIFLRAKCLGQSNDQPMGIFTNHQAVMKYLTASKIAEVFESVAKICHPDLTRDEIMHFTSYSIRVWAVVLLDEAGMNANFIKSRLRWIGDLYRSYLQDNAVLQNKHISALESSSNDVINLFGENRTMIPDIAPVNDIMGPY